MFLTNHLDIVCRFNEYDLTRNRFLLSIHWRTGLLKYIICIQMAFTFDIILTTNFSQPIANGIIIGPRLNVRITHETQGHIGDSQDATYSSLCVQNFSLVSLLETCSKV